MPLFPASRREWPVVRKLSVPLAAVGDTTSYAVDESLSESDLHSEGGQSIGLKTVRVAGTLKAINSEYLFSGTVCGIFDRACDRCLEMTQREYDQNVTWLFEPGQAAHPFEELLHGKVVEKAMDLDDLDAYADEGDEAGHVRHYEGDSIDLGPHVWEEMLLASPGKFLCSESCAGLCSRCGANLNKGSCGCPRVNEEKKSGFAALKDLLPNLESQSVEE